MQAMTYSWLFFKMLNSSVHILEKEIKGREDTRCHSPMHVSQKYLQHKHTMSGCTSKVSQTLS